MSKSNFVLLVILSRKRAKNNNKIKRIVLVDVRELLRPVKKS